MTLTLALSLARARQLLARSVAGESAASDLLRFFGRRSRHVYALASDQGYRPPHPAERRPARDVEGLGDPVDLVVLA